MDIAGMAEAGEMEEAEADAGNCEGVMVTTVTSFDGEARGT
jgi:hypothetical protein